MQRRLHSVIGVIKFRFKNALLKYRFINERFYVDTRNKHNYQL